MTHFFAKPTSMDSTFSHGLIQNFQMVEFQVPEILAIGGKKGGDIFEIRKLFLSLGTIGYITVLTL
jgi:hypothetical protein